MSVRLAGTLMGGALLGKLLGFVREIEMARLIGASLIADSFRGGLTAVLLPVTPIQSDSVPSVLIPLHREWDARGEAAVRSASLALIAALIGGAVAVAVSVLAAPWVGILVGQFDERAQALTIRFVHVMALSLPASTLTSVLGAIEIATGRSRIAAVRASVQNVGLMVGIAVMAWTGQPLAIGWGFTVSFNLVALYGLIQLGRDGALAPGGLRPAMLAEVGLVFWRRFRLLLGIPVAEQGSILVERMLASGVAVGALASLDYARTLTETAFYLVSQPIGYVVLTRTAGRLMDVRGETRRISAGLLALGLPMSVFLVLFAGDIVSVVFGRGAFDAQACRLTASAMAGIGTGLWAAMLGWVLIRLLNAAGRNGAAAAIVMSAYGANALLDTVLAPQLGTLGLGLGEAARGLVLLAAAAAALGCGSVVLSCVLRAGALALPLGLAGGCVLLLAEGAVPRLLMAAPLFAVATAAWLAVALPDQRRRAAALVRRPLRLASRG